MIKTRPFFFLQKAPLNHNVFLKKHKKFVHYFLCKQLIIFCKYVNISVTSVEKNDYFSESRLFPCHAFRLNFDLFSASNAGDA